tara:strand:+ start:8574 stop:9203 length:630 start_codon:yes stop_codon:yes gene_type:complete
MRINTYSQTMAKKSDTALALVLEEKHKYTEEAIQAVIWELENRNIIEKDSIIQNPSVLVPEAVVKEGERGNLLKNAPLEEEEEEVPPILFSKRAIRGFTIFFSTLFGVVLLMHNLKKMNKRKARMEVLFFGIFYTFFTMILLSYLPTTLFITLLFNGIGYVVLTEYFWNKSLGKNVEYQKEQITKPVIISLSIVAFIIYIQFSSGVLQG